MGEITYKIKKFFFHPTKAVNFLNLKARETLLWNYYYENLREPKISSRIRGSSQIVAELLNEMKTNHFEVNEIKLNPIEYKQFLKEAEYHKYRNYYNGGRAKLFFEKSLEHFLAAKLLKLSKNDIYIDIANGNSPDPEIYHKLYGCEVYRQDLIFKKGIRGNRIGGDACNMPIEDGFATKMALHCSFEHFERNSDINFIKESNRVLKTGGKLCILPLYFFKNYAIQMNPVFWPQGNAILEKDAVLYCVKGWGTRHNRFYDLPHFITRIKNHLENLKLTIYHVQSSGAIARLTYVKFIALLEKK
ncbi:MAG: methyltransferase domain-containing protein [Candidatus Helarchaeota archaeon]